MLLGFWDIFLSFIPYYNIAYIKRALKKFNVWKEEIS